MRFIKYVALLLFVILAMSGCHEKVVNPNRNLTLDAFSNMKKHSYAVSSRRIREQINRMIKADDDTMMADFRTRSYYIRKGDFLWIDRFGVDECADSLLSFIRNVDRMGFSPSEFRVKQIERDLLRARDLCFDDSDNTINKTLARLEYNLTKAYLRYATGQRFGFVNPSYAFNKLDVKDSDSVRVTYRGLFDVPMEHAGRRFYKEAFHKVGVDSVSEFLHDVQPKNDLYYVLLSRLGKAKSKSDRARLLCNMERLRWRLKDYPHYHKKFVLVNIPSFRLVANNKGDVLSMRIGCGSFKTKTPLLTSRISRMDINPQWIIPKSIVEKDVIRHIGDVSYFDSHRFFVRERRTGKTVDVSRVSSDMLRSKDYLVVQEGGEGNSLGRIIFRFANDFSVFLHDTSSKDVFSRDDRGVSHGCVRVEKPFDLAVFMLDDKDEKIIDKIKYSMTVNVTNKMGVETKDDEESNDPPIDKDRLLNSLDVSPQIPLFITYFTLYPDSLGHLHKYSDVYGYDRVIYKWLRNYM